MRGETLPSTPEHNALMHVAIGDHEVPTILAHAMARAIGVNLVRSNDPLQPFPREVFGLPTADTPIVGECGMMEYDFALPPESLTDIPTTAGCNPHDRVRELTPSFEQQDTFFRTGRIEWFCDGICNCDSERNEDRCQIDRIGYLRKIKIYFTTTDFPTFGIDKVYCPVISTFY